MKALLNLLPLAILVAEPTHSVAAQATDTARHLNGSAWLLDSAAVNPVYRRRQYSALLTGMNGTAGMLLVCDAQTRLYIQFFTRPLSQAPAPLFGGLPATNVAYRFDEDDAVSGRIMWQQDRPDIGNAFWPSQLRRLHGLDSRPFWKKLHSGRQLAMSFQAVDGELFEKWILPPSTDSVVNALRYQCER